jgi:hypothetical protein
MRHPSPFVTATVLVAFGISACGSSKKSSATTAASPTTTSPVVSIPSPTPATAIDPVLIARANAICARAKTAIGAHGPFPYPNFDPLHPNTNLLPKIGAFFAATQPIADRVPRELRDLGTPHKAQREWTQIVALAQRSRTIGDRQIVAAKASNVPAFVATVNAIHANDMQLGRVALMSGFSTSSPCNAIF